MPFQHRPILSDIKELYSKPRSQQRFQEYLAMLQGDTKGDMALPITGFNPMAKDHILEKIAQLEALHAEELIADVLRDLNNSVETDSFGDITIVVNIADDLKGAWTNRYTTDYDSKFKLSAFVSRRFCVPHFWTSENYSAHLIETRVKSYAYRMQYLMVNPLPVTLEDHVEQETYVEHQLDFSSDLDSHTYEALDSFYLAHRDSDDYSLIFNFFYGDAASLDLGYKTYGVSVATGYDYIRYQSSRVIRY